MAATWLTFVCTDPVFAADTPAPKTPPAPTTTQISEDTSTDSQPVDAVTFLGTGTATPVAPAPLANKPRSSLRLAPIALRLGGDIGYDIEQRSTRGASPTLRQRILLNLRGKANSYIQQPWLAQTRADLIFSSSKVKTDQFGSTNNTISGTVGLFMVPYSRYPFDAQISRTQNYLGPGIGSLSSQTTRYEMNQHFSPINKKERYQLGYFRSLTEGQGPETDRLTSYTFGIDSNRFKNQSIAANATREYDNRDYQGISSQYNQANIDHRLLPSSELSLINIANLRSNSDNAAGQSISTRYRELNSTLSIQPRQAPYTVIGSARVNVNDLSYQQSTNHSTTFNANIGGNYRTSDYLILAASVNFNSSENNSSRVHELSTFQSAMLNYPLASFNLDVYRYNSRFNATVGNRTGNTGATQNITLSPSHGLSRTMELSDGRLDLRIDQSVLVNESTRSQTISRLTNSATANWSHVQNNNNTSLRISGHDNRSLNSTQDSFQGIELYAGIVEEISRDSQLSGNLSVQSNRRVTQFEPRVMNYTSSNAILHFTNMRAFNTPRLRFNSDLRAFSQGPLPVLASSPKDQGTVTWENTLTYNIGRLFTEFKVLISRNGDSSTQSLISFSLKRYF
ncbi:MAG: hypothetical protein ABI479_08765 [Gallionella sp.]